jgi:hypothetical protein
MTDEGPMKRRQKRTGSATLHEVKVGTAASCGDECSGFGAWAASVRAAVAKMQMLAGESRRQEQELERCVQQARPDLAAIGGLVLEMRRRRLEIERIVASLPVLDGKGSGMSRPSVRRAVR